MVLCVTILGVTPASRAAVRSAAAPRAREEEEIGRFTIVLFDVPFLVHECLHILVWPLAQQYMAYQPITARRPSSCDSKSSQSAYKVLGMLPNAT